MSKDKHSANMALLTASELLNLAHMLSVAFPLNIVNITGRFGRPANIKGTRDLCLNML